MKQQTGQQASQTADEHKLTLTWNGGKHNKTIWIDTNTNVFTMQMTPTQTKYTKYCKTVDKINLTCQTSMDDTEQQQKTSHELLALHEKCSHISMTHLIHMVLCIGFRVRRFMFDHRFVPCFVFTGIDTLAFFRFVSGPAVMFRAVPVFIPFDGLGLALPLCCGG